MKNKFKKNILFYTFSILLLLVSNQCLGQCPSAKGGKSRWHTFKENFGNVIHNVADAIKDVKFKLPKGGGGSEEDFDTDGGDDGGGDIAGGDDMGDSDLEWDDFFPDLKGNFGGDALGGTVKNCTSAALNNFNAVNTWENYAQNMGIKNLDYTGPITSFQRDYFNKNFWLLCNKNLLKIAIESTNVVEKCSNPPNGKDVDAFMDYLHDPDKLASPQIQQQLNCYYSETIGQTFADCVFPVGTTNTSPAIMYNVSALEEYVKANPKEKFWVDVNGCELISKIECLGLSSSALEEYVKHPDAFKDIIKFSCTEEDAKIASYIAITGYDSCLSQEKLNELSKVLQKDIDQTVPAYIIWYLVQMEYIRLGKEFETMSESDKWVNAWLNVGHILLDVAGFVPVIGEIADITNGVIYSLQGDATNACFSFAAAIPIAGWASTGTKYAIKTMKAIGQSGRTYKLTYKIVNNSVIFGESNALRAQLRLILQTVKGYVAHHVIPLALSENKVVQAAAKSKLAFHINEFYNGINISSLYHSGSHPAYTSRVETSLNEIANACKKKYPNATELNYEFCFDEIQKLTKKIRDAITANPTTNINNIVW